MKLQIAFSYRKVILLASIFICSKATLGNRPGPRSSFVFLSLNRANFSQAKLVLEENTWASKSHFSTFDGKCRTIWSCRKRQSVWFCMTLQGFLTAKQMPGHVDFRFFFAAHHIIIKTANKVSFWVSHEKRVFSFFWVWSCQSTRAGLFGKILASPNHFVMQVSGIKISFIKSPWFS